MRVTVLARRLRWRPRPGSATTNRAPCGRAGSHHSRAPIDSPRRLAAYRPMPEPRAVCVSRRAYGSKMRSRHSSGMPGTLVDDAELDDPLDERPVDPDAGLRRGVLDRVLDEVLEDLAEPRRIGQRRAAGRRHDLDAVRLEERPERGDDFVDERPEVDRADRRRALGHDPDRRQDGVDEAVEALDLLERRPVPRGAGLAPRDVARFAAAQRRLVGQQVGVGADDRERRPQLVGDERDQLAARLVDRLERLDPRLGLGLLAALLDDARRAGRRWRRAGRRRLAERPRLLGLDVEDADRLVVPGQRHATASRPRTGAGRCRGPTGSAGRPRRRG